MVKRNFDLLQPAGLSAFFSVCFRDEREREAGIQTVVVRVVVVVVVVVGRRRTRRERE